MAKSVRMADIAEKLGISVVSVSKGLAGKDGVSEQAVMAAGKAAGLVDVKVARFSAERSALKLVVPVKDRAKKK